MEKIKLTKFLINEDNFHDAFHTVIKDIENDTELKEDTKLAIFLSSWIIIPRMRKLLFGEEKESEQKC